MVFKEKKNKYKIKINQTSTASYKFSKDTLKLRKNLNILFLLILIVGYSSLVIYNAIIFVSFFHLKIEPHQMSASQPNNETYIISGEVDVETIIEITDLNVSLSIMADDNTTLINDDFIKDRIPPNEKTTIKFNFTFDINEMDVKMFESLNSTETLTLKVDASLVYGGYRIGLIIITEYNMEEI